MPDHYKGQAGNIGAIKNFLFKNAKKLTGGALFEGKLRNTTFEEPPILFFNFGKNKVDKTFGAFGEPDAILISSTFTIYFEFETARFTKSKKPFAEHVWPQIERFYSFGKSTLNPESTEYVYKSADTKRKYKIANQPVHVADLANKMKQTNNFYVICVTDDTKTPEVYRKLVKDIYPDDFKHFGWMGYPLIKKWARSEPCKTNWPTVSKLMNTHSIKWPCLTALEE